MLDRKLYIGFVALLLILKSGTVFSLSQTLVMSNALEVPNICGFPCFTSWSGFGNISASDNLYTSADFGGSDNTTNWLYASTTSFTIPPTATITGFGVAIERSCAGANNVFDLSVMLDVTGANRAAFPNWPKGLDMVFNYGNSADLWGKPAPTPAFVNSGYGVYIRAASSGNLVVAQIDQVTITVYYTLPAPLTWISFEAKQQNENAALLNWTTTDEINTDRFEIERSEDGINFERQGIVVASNIPSGINKYSYKDNSTAFSDESYYRLKQVDKDGKYEYSKIVKALIKSDRSEVVLFPNPIIDQLFWSGEDPESIEIAALSGNVISKFENPIGSIKLEDLNSGVYLLKIEKKDQQLIYKKIIVN